ncbi:MAG: 50S ribosomal protein L21 [Dehalococcoidales bacterium]|nr:50S ribosomal protein L21 [Dehalococcoidales bacterium]
MYAIIETGGKQYKVTPGQTIEVERLAAIEGSLVELDRVLLLADGDSVSIGAPVVDGARVVAKSLGEQKDDKIIVFKYKNKVRYRNKTGHRQIHTRLMIDKILKPGEVVEPVKKPRRTRKKAAEAEPIAEETKEVTESGS